MALSLNDNPASLRYTRLDRLQRRTRQPVAESATLAERAGASPKLVVAALLHVLGHLLNLQGETPTKRGIDDLHQYFALPFLRPLFSDAVLEPIRLHVDAKRCLCAIDASYRSRLSADSVRSLQLQGGVFALADGVRLHRDGAARSRLAAHVRAPLSDAGERISAPPTKRVERT